jgi:steroid delta-isomerase-like uncharacterized protein
MSSEETRKMAQKHHDVLNQSLKTGNFDLLNGMVSENYIEHNPAQTPGEGTAFEKWKASLDWYRSIFPDMQFNVKQILVDGDKAAVHVLITGTHQGEGMGFPATGKVISLEAIDILRFQDEKVVEHWGVYDELSMMRQLGLVPE